MLTFRQIGPFVLLAFMGCGSDGPRQYPVSGEVKFQGTPVAEGEIIFADANDKAANEFGRISSGHYQLKTTAGEKIVRISASKETGKMLEGAMGAKIPERIDLIPASYNTESTLRKTVEEKTNNGVDFDLK